MSKQEFLNGRIVLHNTDCLDFMTNMQEKINLILTDPPYLYLDHKLDKKFNQELFFDLSYKILDKNSIMAFFGRGKSFYYWNVLADKVKLDFKEEVIWDKNQGSSPTLSLQRIHETIAVYQKGHKPVNKVYIDYGDYNIEAEKTILNDLKKLVSLIKNCKTIEELNQWKEGKLTTLRTNKKHNITHQLKKHKDRAFSAYQLLDKGKLLPSIIKIKREHFNFIHPTQKPVELLKHLINLCSQENELVFDGFSGSGSCAVACIKTNRRFIGCELDNQYFDLACKQIETELKQPSLF
jgi:site-specific DNA-methyltransferase (adenine-specific)